MSDRGAWTTETSRSFDLGELARAYEASAVRPTRQLNLIVGPILGAGLVALGLYFLLAGPTRGSLGTLQGDGFLTLILGGIALVAVGVWLVQSPPTVVTRLSISLGGVTLTVPGAAQDEIRWSDQRTYPTINDQRGLRHMPVPFALVWRPRSARILVAPIPIEAVRLIVDEAKHHGWIVRGWDEVPPRRGSLRQIALMPESRANPPDHGL